MQQAENNVFSNERSDEDIEKEVKRLKGLLESYANLYRNANSRKARCELLMRRVGSKNWTQRRKTKMVKRLMTASKEIREAEEILDKIQSALQALNVEVDVVSYRDLNVKK